MFGTGTRFAEYGITGGFFLFFHFVVLGVTFPEIAIHNAQLAGDLFAGIVGKIPAPAQPALQSLLIALALLSVFITGLLLDLFGSVFVLAEARVFRTQISRRAHWIENLIETELPDYIDDYRSFRLLAGNVNMLGGANPSVSKFWRTVRSPTRHSFLWRFFRAYFRGFVWQRRVQQLFRRLEFAFIAKVLASGAKVDMMTEQVSVCRISRALAAALSALILEVFLIQAEANDFAAQQIQILLWIGPLILASYVGGVIVVGAYSRFCQILFSLLYVTSQRVQKTVS